MRIHDDIDFRQPMAVPDESIAGIVLDHFTRPQVVGFYAGMAVTLGMMVTVTLLPLGVAILVNALATSVVIGLLNRGFNDGA